MSGCRGCWPGRPRRTARAGRERRRGGSCGFLQRRPRPGNIPILRRGGGCVLGKTEAPLPPPRCGRKMAMLKIWGRASSSNVQKVLWGCAELDLPFERVDLGGPFGGHRDPEYLQLNPKGLVPTVKDGDLIMWESNTICRYLASTHHGERLYPREAAARTHVERWMDGQPAVVAGPRGQLLSGLARPAPEPREPAAIE